MPTPRKINIKKALQMRLKGASYQDIAEAIDCHKSNVFRAIKPILDNLTDPQTIAMYRDRQADILDGIAVQTLASISNEDFSKASLQQKMVSAGIAIDKSRLVQNLSTQNVGLQVASAVRAGADDDY